MPTKGLTVKTTLFFALAASFLLTTKTFASVESTVFNTIALEASPLDIATTADGIWTCVLTEGGKVFIYSADGQLNDIIEGEPTANRIFVVGRNRLYLSSQETKTIQLILLNFSAEIDIQGAPFMGPEKAPVIITIFSDFECPFCSKIGEEIEKVLANNPETVKVAYKHYPLPNHKYAAVAALAAMAAQEQGKFWQYHDLAFKYQDQLTQQKLIEIAQELGLDMEQFNKDVARQEIKEKLTKDVKDGQGAGVKGTPSIYVNGREAVKVDHASLQQMIDYEMKIIKRGEKKEQTP